MHLSRYVFAVGGGGGGGPEARDEGHEVADRFAAAGGRVQDGVCARHLYTNACST